MSSEEEDQYNSESEEDTLELKKVSKTATKAKQKIIINISDCQYPVVRRVSKTFKWKLQKSAEATDWDVCWTDNAVQSQVLLRMDHHQKINHFPGMFNLARKNLMGRYLMKMRKKFPSQYSFFPLTWMLPVEYHELKAYFESKPKGKARTFIVKPEAMSQGKGIFLTRKIEDIDQYGHYVVQRYLHKPYLIEGLKFDLRIYVLVASVDPLRLYIFNEGLTRFATQKYVPPTRDNMEDVCMHLTNYAINKDNPKFVFNNTSNDMSKGHKRSLSWLYKFLEENDERSAGLQQKIEDMIVKTMISGLPPISYQYRSCQPENYSSNMCFELLGFDVILTQKCEPILLEINHTPSFSTDTPLDDTIKTNYIHDSLLLMNINEKTKRKIMQQRKQACQQRVLTGKKVKLSIEEKQVLKKKAMEDRDKYERKNLGGFKKIFPLENQVKMKIFDELLQFSEELFKISTGTKKGGTLKKTEKAQSAFGSCFSRKKESKETSSTRINNKHKTNFIFTRKYESKNNIVESKEVSNEHVAHSENLIPFQNNVNNSSEHSSTQKNEDENQLVSDVSPNCFYSLTPVNHTNSSGLNILEEAEEFPQKPLMHHTKSLENQQRQLVSTLKSRNPLEESDQYSSQNKLDQDMEEENINNVIGQKAIKKRKPFKFQEEFQKGRIKDSYSMKQNCGFGVSPARTGGYFGATASQPQSKQEQLLKITNILCQPTVKNVDILFEEPDRNMNNRKSNNVSRDGKRSGFEINNMGKIKEEKDNKKKPQTGSQGRNSGKYRNISNREKIPIMLNTLLINGSEGNSAISVNNLRKILNNQ